MRFPIPCKFGTAAMCNGKLLPFVGVSWFHWSEGMEYTYFFRTKDDWHPFSFYISDGAEYTSSLEMQNIK